jgi:DNA-binding transcriptional LysR family regulator
MIGCAGQLLLVFEFLNLCFRVCRIFLEELLFSFASLQMNQIPWDDFRLVKAIADTRSLNGAADILNINHSTVFRRLSDLEKRIGNILFERHRSGYALTPAGEEMAQLAGRMEDDVEAFSRKLDGQSLIPTGELRVTTNDTLLVYLLMPVFAAFRRAYPTINLDIVLTNQLLNLSKRDADIAIRATDSPPETLVGRRICGLNWAIYGLKIDFPDTAHGVLPELNGLASRLWVSLGDQFGHMRAVRYVHERVPEEQIALKINTVLGLTEAVEEGIGIGPLPCLIADQRPKLVRLTEPNPVFATGLWLLTHPDLKASPRVRAFLDVAALELSKRKAMIEGSAPLSAIQGNN